MEHRDYFHKLVYGWLKALREGLVLFVDERKVRCSQRRAKYLQEYIKFVNTKNLFIFIFRDYIFW